MIRHILFAAKCWNVQVHLVSLSLLRPQLASQASSCCPSSLAGHADGCRASPARKPAMGHKVGSQRIFGRQQIRWMRVTGCLSAFVRIFCNSQSAGWRRISTGPNCSHRFHDGADAISWTTINIAVSPKSGNVPSKFARHVRELMFQNARTIGNVSRVWQYKQYANQGSTAALEAYTGHLLFSTFLSIQSEFKLPVEPRRPRRWMPCRLVNWHKVQFLGGRTSCAGFQISLQHRRAVPLY